MECKIHGAEAGQFWFLTRNLIFEIKSFILIIRTQIWTFDHNMYWDLTEIEFWTVQCAEKYIC